MSKHEIDSTKRWLATVTGMAGLLLGGAGLTGCADAPEDDGEVVDTMPAAPGVARDALDNALLNEREMLAQGYTLEGRVWFQPDVQASVYVGESGARLGLMTMRAGTSESFTDRLPPPDETFDAYLKRVAEGKTPHPLMGFDSTGPNVALFDPQPTRNGNLAVTQSALVGFEACSSSWFNARCAEWAGVYGNSKGLITSEWRLTDRTTANTQSQNDVTGEMAVACADKGTTTLQVTNTGAVFGPTTGSMTVTLNQGFAQVAFNVAGWKQEEYCKTKVLGVCVDYAFRIKLAHFDSSIRVTPAANSEVQFCGKFSKLDDYYQGDLPCQDLLTCPLQCAPGNTRCAR